MRPAAEHLSNVVHSLSPPELGSVVALALGLREQVDASADELREQLATVARLLAAQHVHALVAAARALA